MRLAYAILIVAPAMLATGSAATEERLTSHLSEDGKTISYSPCGEEEFAECVTHTMDCRDGRLSLTALGIIGPDGPDIAGMAKTLIGQPFGDAQAHFIIGPTTVDLPINAIAVSTNEMNGDWDLTLRFADDGKLLNKLDGSTTSLKAEVAGVALTLAATPGDAEKLAALKKSCAR